MKQILYILPTIILSCTATSAKDTSLFSVPQCLTDVDQLELWNRLGTPNSVSLTNQVAPSLLVYNSELWLYYSQRDGLTDAITLIRSVDGESWSEPEIITDLSDFSNIMHMNVSMRNDGLMSYIGGGRIGEVQSTDGYHWETVDIQIVPTGDFDSLGQLYPSLNNDGSQMWYTGFNGQTYSIGSALVINGAWQNQGVVIEVDAESDYENRAVSQSSVVESEEGYWIWYGGYDTFQTDPGPWRILSAWSDDGITWDNRQLALDLTASGEEAWSVREPSVALWGDILWMAYIGMGDGGEYRLRLASCE